MKEFLSKKLGLKIALLSIFLGLIGLVYSSYQAYAANVTAGVLSISFDGDRLFSETNLSPGDEVVKTLTVTNNGTLPHSFSIAASNVSGSLAEVLRIEPREGALVFWNESLANLASLPDGSKVIIPSILPGQSRTIQIAAILPADVGNNYQGQSTSNFSFVMGNESTDQPEPTTNPSPPVTLNTTTGNTTGTIGGGATGEELQPQEQTTTGETGESTLGATSEETKGAATVARSLCFWWIVILVILVAFLLIYHRYISEERPIFWWFWPILMAAILFFIQMIFDRYYEPTIFCRWFWAFEIVILAGFYLFENYLASREAK